MPLSYEICFLGVIFIIGFDAFVDIYSNSSNNLIAKLAIILSALGYVVSSILAYNLKKIDTFTLTTGVNEMTGGSGNDSFDGSTDDSLNDFDVLDDLRKNLIPHEDDEVKAFHENHRRLNF